MSPLLANAGTPLMWAGCCQLLVGNFVLGMVEGWLIGRWTRTTSRPGWMTFANYVSMGAGFGLIWLAGPLREAAARDPFRLGPVVIAGILGVAWLLSVLVEWPFVAKTASLPFGLRSLALSLRVQSVTYVGLLVLVLLFGSVSAVTGLRPVPPAAIKTVAGWVYYVDLDAVTVLRTRLDGSKTETVTRLKTPMSSWARLTVEPTLDGKHSQLMRREQQETEVVQKRTGTASQSAPVEHRMTDGAANFGNVVFGPHSTRSFAGTSRVHAGFWAREGLIIRSRRYALETPGLALAWRSPVALRDGKVVAQFGNAIVLIDPGRGWVGKLGEGFGGDVLLDRAPQLPRPGR